MRINKFIAQSTGMSRRAADTAIASGRVTINGQATTMGYDVTEQDSVMLDDTLIAPLKTYQTIMLNKPRGYVCSRDGQGSQTIYDLLPIEFHHLKPIGRLDKDSSGLLLMTNDGNLAHELTHPSRQKTKIYLVTLDQPLAPLHQQMISDYGVQLEDGLSKFIIDRTGSQYSIAMREGRNRQIRRTFAALGYRVKTLHRTYLGSYNLGDLKNGAYITI
jgi:23S rRNA pseudouridine2605 synthase